MCFEDPDKVLRLLTELELSFPQNEGAMTNNELGDKIALVRAELRNREEGTIPLLILAQNFDLVAQTCQERSTPVMTQNVDGCFLVLSNLKVSFMLTL